MLRKVSKGMGASIRRSALLRMLLETKEGKIVVAQFPNPPLFAWATIALLAVVIHGTLGRWLGILSEIALLYWALLEIFWGVNLFRRLLGGTIAVAALLSLIRG